MAHLQQCSSSPPRTDLTNHLCQRQKQALPLSSAARVSAGGCCCCSNGLAGCKLCIRFHAAAVVAASLAIGGARCSLALHSG